DVRGAIRLACSDDSIAPNDIETFNALLEKHPAHPHELVEPETPATTTPSLLDVEVRAAILSFPPGSAGGLDGLRPQILKELLDVTTVGEWGDKFVSALKRLLDIILCCTVPDVII